MPGKGGNTIKVCVRLRPCEPCCSSHWLVNDRSIQLADSQAEPSVFDYVFDEGTSNQEVFDRMAQRIICTSMLGFNGTILAYGQKLSGKTYTMMGDDENPGVMVLAAKEIFQKIAKETSRDFLLRASYIEIYNQKINDLLNKKNQDLTVHEIGHFNVRVDSEECIITSEDDLLRLICPGNEMRSVHSHAILRIIIESWRSDRRDAILHSTLNLVDLAGSERLSGDSPPRVKDSVHINKSLMFLSNVVNQLSDNPDNKYISFRDCKLTRFLESSLRGNAFTSIICTIRPTIIEESQSTLNFATRAKRIRIKPQGNKHGITMLKLVDREINRLRDQLAVEKQKEDNELEVQTLESKLIAEQLKIISRQPLHAPSIKHHSSTEAGISEISRAFAHKSTSTTDLTITMTPKMYEQSIQKIVELQDEVSALTASNQAANDRITSYEEQVKLLNKTIARLEMENHIAVELKQQFDSHKAQAQQLEIDLQTSIKERDITIEDLRQSVKSVNNYVERVETMQAECHALQRKYESLQRTSDASEEECQKLQAENMRMQLEIGTLKERLNELHRKLMEAPSQEVEGFKVQREFQKGERVRFQEVYISLSNQLWEFENNVLQDEHRAMKASVVGTEQGPYSNDDLLEQFAKLLKYFNHIGITLPPDRLFTSSEPNHNMGETTEANAIGSILLKGMLNQNKFQFAKKSQELIEVGEKMLLRIILYQLMTICEEENFQRKDTEATSCTLQNAPIGKMVLGSTLQEIQVNIEFDEKLAESLKHAEARQEQIIPISEYEKQIEELRELLRKTKNEQKLMLEQKTDDINALQLEYHIQMKRSENENRAYVLELQESKDLCEREVANLKEELFRSKEQLSRVTDRFQAEKDALRQESKTLREKLHEAAENRKQMDVAHSMELEKVRADLQDKIRQAEDERNKALDELAMMRSSQKEYARLKEEALLKELHDAAENRKQMDVAHSMELEKVRADLQDQIRQAKDERNKALDELAMMRSSQEEYARLKEEALLKELHEAAENRKQMDVAHSMELKKVRAHLQDKIRQADDERNKALDKLAMMRSSLEEYARLKEEAQLKELHEAAENRKQMDVAHSMELEKVRADLQNKIRQAEDERNKSLDELAMMRSSLEEYARLKEEAQLKAVSNEHKDLEASQEQIQELQQKYDQLAIYADNLRDEKLILQIKIDKAEAEHSSTLRKLQELEVQMDDMSQQRVTEKSDLEERLETMTAKIGDLESELQNARLKAASLDDLISEHEHLKLSLSEATGESSKLQEKVDSLQSQLLASERDVSSRDLEMEKLRSDLKHALETKDSASADKLVLTTKLQAVEEKMASQAGKFEKELADLNSSFNELKFKLKSLQEGKDELESESEELKVKLRNAHNLLNQLEKEQKLCVFLQTEIAVLEETKTRLEEQLRSNKAEVNGKILEKSQEVELGRRSISELTKKCDNLRCDLQTKTESFLKEKEGLESTISTLSKEKQLLEERISSLSLNDNRNAELIAKLRTKEAESESLRETAITQKLAAEATNIKCRQFMEQKVELTKEIEQLRTTLKSKETIHLTERESMNATISSLLEDKRNLEEKQCTLYERVGKLEEELSAVQGLIINRCNSSVKSNGPLTSHISVKPLTPNNLDPKTSVIKKSSIIDSAGRRERRKTAHDEHRKQSYWNDSRDFGTMTDPEDS